MLRIDDDPIYQISGPVSMYYLKPPSLEFPLVLLFGDVHQSRDDLCGTCEERYGCYPIYSKKFLRKLDGLAEHYAVDFFTESAPSIEPDETQGILFGDFLSLTKGCHHAASRGKSVYGETCPTRNMRWHYADTRFFDKLEGNTLIPLRDVISHYVLKGVRVDPTWSPEGKKIVEGLFKHVLYAIENHLPYEAVMEEVADWMVSSLNVPGSALYKQLFVYDLRSLWKTEYYINTMNTLLPRLPYESFKQLSAYFMEGKGEPGDKVKEFENLVIALSGRILDMYMIARMLKPSLGSTLSIGFFGQAHSTNIYQYLVDTLGYRVAFATESKRRCVTVDRLVDLVSDLMPYQLNQAYREQIERERMEREEDESKLFQKEVLIRYKKVSVEAKEAFRLFPSEDIELYTPDIQQILYDNVKACVQMLAEDGVYISFDKVTQLLDRVMEHCNDLFRRSLAREIILSCVAVYVPYPTLERVFGVTRVSRLRINSMVEYITENIVVDVVDVVPPSSDLYGDDMYN